jgi:CRP/FNR family transcriptional regulator, cyclic AMP receptor protein
MSNLETKKIFLVATGSKHQNQLIERTIVGHYTKASIFSSLDGVDAHFKADNVTPHVVILDYLLPRMDAVTLTQKLLRKKDRMAIIILSPKDDSQHFLDQVITGQVQFLTNTENPKSFLAHINRALNWAAFEEQSLYKLRFLNRDELLLREGEEGKFVYLVRSGRLKAIRNLNGKEVLLGFIEPGEFVGEMAYINGEPRSADVQCLTDVELIEIPSGLLDSILFSKPAWSKALVKTLSRRLKDLNQKQVGS